MLFTLHLSLSLRHMGACMHWPLTHGKSPVGEPPTGESPRGESPMGGPCMGSPMGNPPWGVLHSGRGESLWGNPPMESPVRRSSMGDSPMGNPARGTPMRPPWGNPPAWGEPPLGDPPWGNPCMGHHLCFFSTTELWDEMQPPPLMSGLKPTYQSPWLPHRRLAHHGAQPKVGPSNQNVHQRPPQPAQSRTLQLHLWTRPPSRFQPSFLRRSRPPHATSRTTWGASRTT